MFLESCQSAINWNDVHLTFLHSLPTVPLSYSLFPALFVIALSRIVKEAEAENFLFLFLAVYCYW